jgi:hypothetical protein
MAVECPVKGHSIDGRPFRPRDLTAGLFDFLPQESQDIIYFQDLAHFVGAFCYGVPV